MVDITILGQLEINSRPIVAKHIYKNYYVFQYADQIIITKLVEDKLMFYDSLRYFDENTFIIKPAHDSTNLFMVVEKQKIQKYTFATKSMQIISGIQFNRYFQISDDRILGLYVDSCQQIVVDILNNQEISAKDVSFSGKFTEDLQIFDLSEDYFAIYSENSLIIIQTADFQIKAGFPMLTGMKNCFTLDAEHPICMIFHNQMIIANYRMDRQVVSYGFSDYADSWVFKDELYIQRYDRTVYKFNLQLKSFLSTNCKTKQLQIGLSCISDELVLNQSNKITHVTTGYDNIEILSHVKLIRSQPFTRNNGRVGNQYVLMPIVAYYDHHLKQLVFFDLITFNKLSFNTEPISQFCVTCTKKINFIGFSIFNDETQESFIQIFCMNAQFTEASLLTSFYCFDRIQSLTICFDEKIVVTAVTQQNTVYVRRCEEEGIAYCFLTSFEVVGGLELPDEQNLYLIGSDGIGHFVTVPQEQAQATDFSHILDTTNHIYDQFKDILSLYSTRFNIDKSVNKPIILPPDKDVETIAYENNMATITIDIPPEQLLKVQQLNQISSFYKCYDHCFQIKVKNLIQRLDQFRLFIKQIFQSQLTLNSDYSTGAHTKILVDDGRVSTSIDIASVVRERRSCTTLFKEIQKQFKNYNVEQLLTHSLFQTINFSKFPSSEVFSYNMLSIFFQNQRISINGTAQFVLEMFCRKALPLVYSVCTDIDKREIFTDYVSMMNQLFQSEPFDYKQLNVGLHTCQLCHSEKNAYKFTLAMITMFAILASIVNCTDFKGQKITPAYFQLVENTLTAYFGTHHNSLCLYNLYDFISQTDMISRYSCITLIRLFQQLSCKDRRYQEITSYLRDVCHELSSIQTSGSSLIPSIAKMPHFILVVETLAQPVYQELLRLSKLKRIKSQQLTLETCVTNNVVNQTFQTEESTMQRVDSEALNLSNVLEVEITNELKDAIGMLNGAVQQLLCLITSLNENEIAEIHNRKDQDNILSFSSLAIHSLCYNMFYINSIENYKIAKQEDNDDDGLDKFDQFKGTQLQNDLNEAFIKYSFVFPNDTQRFFCFEQLTQYCFKCNRSSFIQLIKGVVQRAQQEIFYKSLVEYITFLRYNYPCILEEFGPDFIDLMLPIARELFAGILHTKVNKPLVLALLKIIGQITKISQQVAHITNDKLGTSTLYYQSKAGCLDTFDFKNYTQEKIFLPDASLRIITIDTDLLEKDKLMLFICCAYQNTLILSFDVNSSDYLVVPLILKIEYSIIIKYDQLQLSCEEDFIIPTSGDIFVGYCLDQHNIKFLLTSNQKYITTEFGSMYRFPAKKMSATPPKCFGAHKQKGQQIVSQKHFGLKRKIQQVVTKDQVLVLIARK